MAITAPCPSHCLFVLFQIDAPSGLMDRIIHPPFTLSKLGSMTNRVVLALYGFRLREPHSTAAHPAAEVLRLLPARVRDSALVMTLQPGPG